MNEEVWGHKNGAELIAQERQRQIEAEGWTPEHDDEHRDGELAKAATAYIDAGLVAQGGDVQSYFPYDKWPWERAWWKPSEDPMRNLVKAGALIAAEIDRLRRAEAIEYEPCSCMNENGETVRVGPEDFCTECFTPRGCCGPGRPVDRGSNGTS